MTTVICSSLFSWHKFASIGCSYLIQKVGLEISAMQQGSSNAAIRKLKTATAGPSIIELVRG